MASSAILLRLGLLITAVAIAVFLIAAHGVRGVALIVGVGLIVTIPRTKPWRAVEGILVRLTGSRRRAAVLAAVVLIVAAAAINLYQFFG